MTLPTQTATELEGQRVPFVMFHTHKEDNSLTYVSTDELFKNKKVVVFSLPGAFTPTCSSSHLPRYNELASEFQQRGVDDIVCISVNDAFVMNAWANQQNAQHITFIPDGNGSFTKGMGMWVNQMSAGLGYRSWRYAMFVNDGIIEKMFIEPPANNSDALLVSDADTMLRYLDPTWQTPPSVSIITKLGCSFCAKAKALLQQKGYAFDEMVVGRDVSLTSLRAMTGKETVPQIFIGGQCIGGNDDLTKYFANQNMRSQ